MTVRPRPPLWLASLITLAAFVAMTWLRVVVFPDRLVPLTYALPLLLALWHRDRRVHWALAGGFLVISAIKFFGGLEWALPEGIFWFFWSMQLANILIAAVVIDLVNLMRERLDARNAALAAANAELEASNEELAAREEEIARQNEELEQQTGELQQQTEELQEQAEEMEAQAEDLRAANDELARKEATLTALLGLSGPAEDEQRTLDRICQLVPGLFGGAAAAILERAGDELVVRAQRGLRDAKRRIPLANSFSALVLEKGEAAVLADADLRPDLHLPPAADDSRPRAVMAAPLRVWGEAVGTLKVYAAEPREWDAGQLRLLQWLADQASLVWERVQVQAERRRDREALARLNRQLEDRVRERTALAEQRAERLREMTGELTRAEHRERRRLAGLLHDHLQQMLVAAKLHLGMIRKDGSGPQREAAARVDEMLRQAIETSRTLTVELSPPILHEAGLAAGLEWLVRSYRQKHELEVELEVEPDLAVEDVDLRVFAYEATRELLFNVVKHAGCKRARAAARRDGPGSLELLVTDEGQGMNGNGRLLPSEGGFGLFSIQQRAELLGGELRIRSEPGRGTEIRLVLPLNEGRKGLDPLPEAAATAGRRGRATAHPEGKIRVLVVDDHAVVRSGLAMMLASDPAIEVVGEAGDGLEAIGRALELRPDVVVMDVSMPRLDGVEATRRLSAQCPNARVIGLSMYEHEDRGRAMLEAGARAYLSKDAPGEQLIAQIRAVAAAPARRVLAKDGNA